jgi:hypothetical protein
MKIEDLLFLHNTPTPRQTQAPAGETFTECLKGVVASTPTGQPAPAVAGPGQVSELGPVDEVLQTSAEMADAALSRLEIFQTSLTRAETSLKKMAPLVQKLDEDSRRLQEVSQELPEGSPLRQVLEETAALAYVESFKFNRGDYL